MKKILSKILGKRVMVIDGAMGSYIREKYSSSELSEKALRGKYFEKLDFEKWKLKGNFDVFNITHPEMIQKIHEEYLSAGADFVTTNTFSSTRREQEKYGLADYAKKMAFEGAKIARKACDKFSDKKRFVLGSIGPQSKSLSISTDVNDPSKREMEYDDLQDSYYEQICALVEGGADVLLIETIFDTLNAKAAISAVWRYYEKTGKSQEDIPVFMSATIEKSGRMLAGQTIESFYISTEHVGMLASGLNCGLGGDFMYEYVKNLSDLAKNTYVHCYPNGGLPNEFGHYDQTPEQMVKAIAPMLKEKCVNMVGGCCGTTPKHIEKIAEFVKKFKPRTLDPEKDHSFKLCGLEKLIHVDNFLHVGERCNVAGSFYFKKLIVNEDYKKALNVAKKQVLNGAEILDICLDEPLVDANSVMKKFLNLIGSDPGICKVPIMIDSSKFEVIVTGLKCLQGKGIVNSLSLKSGEADFLDKARQIKQLGAAIVIMAFDEKGQATDGKKKFEICKRSYDLLTKKLNFPPQDIIFDPNVLTIGTGIPEHDNYAVDFLDSIKMIKKNLPYAKVSGGISNLSFSLRGNNRIRNIMHSIFLYYGRQNGLDMAIVNMGHLPVYFDIDKVALEKAENLVLNKKVTALKELLEYIEKEKLKRGGKDAKDNVKKIAKWRTEPVEKRLEFALVKGIDSHVDVDLKELLEVKKMEPLLIVENVLMKGMNFVGELFGSGRMFLPQVIQSARVMKGAMDVLLPIMKKDEEENNQKKEKRKLLLVTVKGDVHDIGKNIVGCVCECNNYDVKDLGVMCEYRNILKGIKEEKPDVVGMSALITPSLDEMVFNCKQFKKEGLNLPVLIGGASTSEIHTAVKLFPHYKRVIHVEDASQTIKILNQVFTKDGKYNHKYFDSLHTKYEKMRSEYYKNLKSKVFVPLKEAREGKLVIDFSKEKPERKPQWLGTKEFEIGVEEFMNKINWIWYFYSWGYKPDFPYDQFPKIFEEPTFGKEVKKLYEDSLALLEKVKKNLVGKAMLSFHPCNSTKDDNILIFDPKDDDKRDKEATVFHCIREQLQKESVDSPYLCLSDFVAPVESKIKDYIGLYVGSIFGEDKIPTDLVKEKYNKLMFALLSDRLAEALAEHIHEKARVTSWGYSKEKITNVNDLFSGKFQGIRPAIGYPSFPDHHEKVNLWKFLDVEKKIGTKLTESTMMIPKSSTCCFFFSHKRSKYFSLNQIGEDQFSDLCKRKNMEKEKLQHFVSSVLSLKKEEKK